MAKPGPSSHKSSKSKSKKSSSIKKKTSQSQVNLNPCDETQIQQSIDSEILASSATNDNDQQLIPTTTTIDVVGTIINLLTDGTLTFQGIPPEYMYFGTMCLTILGVVFIWKVMGQLITAGCIFGVIHVIFRYGSDIFIMNKEGQIEIAELEHDLRTTDGNNGTQIKIQELKSGDKKAKIKSQVTKAKVKADLVKTETKVRGKADIAKNKLKHYKKKSNKNNKKHVSSDSETSDAESENNSSGSESKSENNSSGSDSDSKNYSSSSDSESKNNSSSSKSESKNNSSGSASEKKSSDSESESECDSSESGSSSSKSNNDVRRDSISDFDRPCVPVPPFTLDKSFGRKPKRPTIRDFLNLS